MSFLAGICNYILAPICLVGVAFAFANGDEGMGVLGLALLIGVALLGLICRVFAVLDRRARVLQAEDL